MNTFRQLQHFLFLKYMTNSILIVIKRLIKFQISATLSYVAMRIEGVIIFLPLLQLITHSHVNLST